MLAFVHTKKFTVGRRYYSTDEGIYFAVSKVIGEIVSREQCRVIVDVLQGQFDCRHGALQTHSVHWLNGAAQHVAKP